MKKYLVVVMTMSCVSFALPAQAKTFKNGYISFEMQDNWRCDLEQTEWVCRAEDPQEAKEAVIIVAAKEKGPSDTFELYENHMNGPISTVNRNGVAMTSTIKYKAKNEKINDLLWLDGLHGDSEVQNYFTRYLATVKGQIAVLVTFSAYNKFYSKHSGNFNRTVQSLKVLDSKDFGKSPDKPSKSDIYGDPNKGLNPNVGFDPEIGTVAAGKGFFKSKLFLGMLLLIGFLVLSVLKKNLKK